MDDTGQTQAPGMDFKLMLCLQASFSGSKPCLVCVIGQRKRFLKLTNTAGIVQGKGRIASVDSKKEFSTLRIQFPDQRLEGAQIGGSIAINGTCLTVYAWQKFNRVSNFTYDLR